MRPISDGGKILAIIGVCALAGAAGFAYRSLHDRNGEKAGNPVPLVQESVAESRTDVPGSETAPEQEAISENETASEQEAISENETVPEHEMRLEDGGIPVPEEADIPSEAYDKEEPETMQAFAGSVEDEVVRIREIYNMITSHISENVYRKEALENKITAYYEGDALKAVFVPMDTDGIAYRRFYYFDNDHLFFAYYEGKDAHRFYFYQDSLIRWRYSPDASKAQEAENHDLEDSDAFRAWEEEVTGSAAPFFAK